MRTFTFRAVPYHVSVTVYSDARAFEAVTGHAPGDCPGMCSWFDDAEGSHRVCIYLNLETAEGQDLAHECAHAALAISRHAGFDPMGNGEEPFCYLLGYLFDTIQTRIHHAAPKRNG